MDASLRSHPQKPVARVVLIQYIYMYSIHTYIRWYSGLTIAVLRRYCPPPGPTTRAVRALGTSVRQSYTPPPRDWIVALLRAMLVILAQRLRLGLRFQLRQRLRLRLARGATVVRTGTEDESRARCLAREDASALPQHVCLLTITWQTRSSGCCEFCASSRDRSSAAGVARIQYGTDIRITMTRLVIVCGSGRARSGGEGVAARASASAKARARARARARASTKTRTRTRKSHTLLPHF